MRFGEKSIFDISFGDLQGDKICMQTLCINTSNNV